VNQTVSTLQIGDISRADFRTSFVADSENSRIQKTLSLPFRYQPARLALSLSLRQSSLPSPIPDSSGRSIKGDTLFGQDEAELTLWIALIVQHRGQAELTRREFQDLVAAHWARGMEMLSRSIVGATTIEEAFVCLLEMKHVP
jgi:DNA sulfur modification protein DndE